MGTLDGQRLVTLSSDWLARFEVVEFPQETRSVHPDRSRLTAMNGGLKMEGKLMGKTYTSN